MQKLLRVGMVSFAHSTHPERYLSALMRNPYVEVVGISDTDEERARPHAEQYDLPLFASSATLMDLCDAVVICSEYNAHRELVEQAAQKGIHVLCEKPLATTAKEMTAIRDAVANSDITFMVALPCRYIPAVRTAREILQRGDIGSLVAINATNRGACPGSWFTDPAVSGGGAIMDHSAHVADLVRWLADSDIATVMALSGSQLHDLEVEDSGLVQFTLHNGTIGVIDTSWSRQAPLPSTFDITLRLIGTEGTIYVDALAQRIEVYANSSDWVVYGGSIDDAMVNDFIDCVINEKPVPITVEDGHLASLLSLAAYESISQGKFVPIDSVA